MITTVSSEHVIGYPEQGYNIGFAHGNWAWIATFLLVILSWVFIPVYLRSRVYTMPEYIERRFGKNSRWYISILSIFSYVVTKVSVTLFAGALVLESLLGWDKYTSSVALVLFTGAFAIAGGFKSVLYSGVFHMIVLLLGGSILTIYGLSDIGGMEGLQELSKTEPGHFEVFKPLNDDNIPWLGMLIGAPILGIWYWCTDQYMIQRVLSAKNEGHAKSGALFAGFLMILVVFVLILPGFIAKIKFPHLENTHEAYYHLVRDTLPMGVRGFVVAGLLSALISSLMASFNSGSTLFTLDIYKKLYPNADEFKIVNVGKVATFTIVILGLIWVPFINAFEGGLIDYLQLIQSFFAPPLAAIFLVGILWKRANDKAALSVIIVGSVVFILRIVVELGLKFKWGIVSEGTMLYKLVNEFNFLYLAASLFAVYVVLMIVVSLLTSAPDELHTKNLTLSELEASPTTTASLRSKKINISLSILLILTMISIWVALSL